MLRIDNEYPGFSKWFNGAADVEKQRIINHIVNSALHACGIDGPVIAKAMDNLNRAKRYPLDLLREIEGLRDEYDETYFEMNATEPEAAFIYFKKARALTALVFALRSTTDHDRLECIYEALHAIGGKDKVFQQIQSFL